ncbi:MAG: serine protease, partial [Planctomycetaceae bacterium]|nr:serine protease [Planctomycetaceae bacterium]
AVGTSVAQSPATRFVQPTGGNRIPGNETIPWLQATVRIRVENPDGHDWGTGTIIDARGGDALILTCGHIFRDSKGLGRIEVDLFCGNTLKRVPGVCLRYDDDQLDLGLVKIAPQFQVDVIPVAPVGVELQEGMALLSSGCDNAGNPTVREHRVRSLTNVAPSIGAPFHYVQVDNAPVQGRSGGGLFTKSGYLVGVCVAGNTDDNEGLFVPASVVRNELDNAKLSCVYQSPSITRSQSSPVVLAGAVTPTNNSAAQPVLSQTPSQQSVAMPNATIRQPIFVAETDQAKIVQPSFVADSRSVGTQSSLLANDPPPPLTLRPSGFTETRLTDREIATLEELQHRQREGDEIIVIVRSKRNPEQPCEIIQLSDVSAEFLAALTGVSPRP